MGGGVKLSTPIDLKTIETEVANLSGRASSTPISMESLWNEVENLRGGLGTGYILTVSGRDVYSSDGKDYSIPVEWQGCSAVIFHYAEYSSSGNSGKMCSISGIIKPGNSGTCSVIKSSGNNYSVNCIYSYSTDGTKINLKKSNTMGGIEITTKILLFK